jgi:ribosomal-protein-alanine N-acetyltransferase
MEKIYTTDRLILKTLKPTKHNAVKVLNYYERNKDFLQKWEPMRKDFFYTTQYHKRNLTLDYSLTNNLSLLRLWIFKKTDTNLNKIIGTIAFSNIIRGAFLSCFLGYKLDESEIKKGYMSEALEKGIKIIFNEYNLHRIEANVMPHNMPSLRLLEKLGFNLEGYSTNYLKINDNWEDHMRLALLNE